MQPPLKISTDKPKNSIIQALAELDALIKGTYGPAGKGVLIDIGGSQTIADDGFTVLEAYEPKDEYQAAVIKFLRDAARKTNGRAGDGTTTAVLILSSIIGEVMGDPARIAPIDHVALTKELRDAVKEAVVQIRALSQAVETKEELAKVAKNSYGNQDMAEMIADSVHTVGKDGSVTVEQSNALESRVRITKGLGFSTGYASSLFATNENGTAEISLPSVILTDIKINAIAQIAPILEKMHPTGKRDILLIAGEIEGEALQMLAINKLRGSLNIVAVKAPGFGSQLAQNLEDIAVLTGATIISEKFGNNLFSATVDDLGTAAKVTVTNSTTVIEGSPDTEGEVKEQVDRLKVAPDGESGFDKTRREERIAKLSGGIAVIQVGAATESEAKSMKLKVEDAVNATKLAFRDGVVKGGGVTFGSLKTGSDLLDKALQRPKTQLEENGKGSLSEDAIDPTGVAIASLESAVSVAISLINCGGIITTEREKPKDD